MQTVEKWGICCCWCFLFLQSLCFVLDFLLLFESFFFLSLLVMVRFSVSVTNKCKSKREFAVQLYTYWFGTKALSWHFLALFLCGAINSFIHSFFHWFIQSLCIRDNRGLFSVWSFSFECAKIKAQTREKCNKLFLNCYQRFFFH